MKQFLIFCICLIFFTGVNAQRFSSEVFHKGFIVTMQKDTLRGSLKYDMETNAVSIFKNGKIKSFSSQKIAYFEMFDEIQKNYRRFYSLLFQVNYNYKAPIFFELIYEGKTSLLTRERIIQQTVTTTSPYWGGGTTTQLVIDYSFYFLNNKGEITHFLGKRKDLLDKFPKKSVHLRKYIKDNKLNVDERGDLIRIMAFYNSI